MISYKINFAEKVYYKWKLRDVTKVYSRVLLLNYKVNKLEEAIVLEVILERSLFHF